MIVLALEDGTFRLIEVESQREVGLVFARPFALEVSAGDDFDGFELVRKNLLSDGIASISRSAGWRIVKPKASVALKGGRAAVILGDFALRVIDLEANSALARFDADAPFENCALSADGEHIIALDSTHRLHIFEIVDTGNSGSSAREFRRLVEQQERLI
jgi:hypothetical protein